MCPGGCTNGGLILKSVDAICACSRAKAGCSQRLSTLSSAERARQCALATCFFEVPKHKFVSELRARVWALRHTGCLSATKFRGLVNTLWRPAVALLRCASRALAFFQPVSFFNLALRLQLAHSPVGKAWTRCVIDRFRYEHNRSSRPRFFSPAFATL